MNFGGVLRDTGKEYPGPDWNRTVEFELKTCLLHSYPTQEVGSVSL